MKELLFYMVLGHSIVFSQLFNKKNISISALSDLSISSQDSSFRSHGLELVLMGNIQPNAMVMAYVTNHFAGGGASVEEVYIDFKKPSRFTSNIKLGYFRPNFGIINKQHEHTYNFMSAPKSITNLFGMHGWSTLGISTISNLPLAWENYFSINILQNSIGEASNYSGHHHEPAVIESDSTTGFSLAFRFNQEFAINKSSKFALGLNMLNGREKESIGFDLQMKNQSKKYRSFLIQMEYYSSKIYSDHLGISYHPDEELASAYIIIGRQFNKKHHLGIIAEHWSYRLKDQESSSYGIYGAFAPFDDSIAFRFKLLNESGLNNNSYVVLSAVWAIGPHKPQRY